MHRRISYLAMVGVIIALTWLAFWTEHQTVKAAPPIYYSHTEAIQNTAQTITLPSTYNYVSIYSSVGAANVWFNLNGTTASASLPSASQQLPGGAGWGNVTKIPSVTTVKYIGESASGNLTVAAW